MAEALVLTGRGHLLGWSLRELADRLGVTVSVITHHVGSKDRLLRAVVEEALSGLRPPPEDLEWDAWFRAMLLEIRAPLRRYPGTAKWVLLHGPTFPSIMPMIDTGVGALERAGFGDAVGLAFATLFNNAVMTLAVADDRLTDEGDGPRDHGSAMRDLLATGAGRAGMAVLESTLMRMFAPGTPEAHETYYRFVVDTTIAGLTAVRDAGQVRNTSGASKP
ncbi:TetR/AcrR family transcriptional regulator C-terminal domain-containing protein [Pseudonocardia sp. NPDC049635]|uniref:TetR/AcrR family transcriptional regulator n=1 Tax=Pseudonocardia sp. NPDC049635 TaxID=3155506 RepID=UPI00341017A6